MLLRSEAFSHLDVYARYHFVRLLWFHRPIQKRPASVFQLKPSWISLSGYYIQAILLFAMGVKSPPMDVVHYDIWRSCYKISWQKILCNFMPIPLQSVHPNQTIFYLGSSLPPLVGPVAPKLFALVCFFTTQFPNSGLDTETQDHPVPRFQKLTHKSVHLKMNKYCVKMIILQCVWYISCSIGGNLLWHFLSPLR